MKNLPIGIQTFEEIINNHYLYIDKTKQIYDIITTGKAYFLSRPRRFGKSLLCSTLEQIFKGNKELFRDLWIYNSDYKWEAHPVISISMPKTSRGCPGEFEKWLNEKISDTAKENSIDIGASQTIQSSFSKIIKELSKKNKVVIIIDEYDKPILDNISDLKSAEKTREILRNFYSTFKDLDQYLKFIFLTGVTRFSKVSLFSGLNNLYDLTIGEEAATLFGYTQKEVEFYFNDYVESIAKKHNTSKTQIFLQLKNWYNGYSFIN
ncbi:MAG: AAA family ATPase, partial [bacterium]